MKIQTILFEQLKQTFSKFKTFRMAALEAFIDDPEIWFDFIKKSHRSYI